MPKTSKLFAMSMVLATGVLLGLTISAGYAAESSDTIPSEVIRTGFRLQMCLAFFVTMAVCTLLIHEPSPVARPWWIPEDVDAAGEATHGE